MLNANAANRLLGVALIASLTACGGGGLATPPPARALTSPVPTPSPTPPPVVVAPNAMNFTTLGSTQSSNVSEASYAGTFTQTNTCAGIATVSGPTADGTSGYDFTVTSQAGGTCVVTFADAANHQGSLSITVTSANIGIMGKKAR